ncbi:MAG: hypothetical protein ABJC89_27430 [Acidobacteriota bacterium]
MIDPNTRPLRSPEFAQRERRRALWAGLLGTGMSLVILGLSVDAMRTGQWMSLGRAGDSVIMPGWTGALIALFLLFVSGSILWRFARQG